MLSLPPPDISANSVLWKICCTAPKKDVARRSLQPTSLPTSFYLICKWQHPQSTSLLLTILNFHTVPRKDTWNGSQNRICERMYSSVVFVLFLYYYTIYSYFQLAFIFRFSVFIIIDFLLVYLYLIYLYFLSI